MSVWESVASTTHSIKVANAQAHKQKTSNAQAHKQ